MASSVNSRGIDTILWSTWMLYNDKEAQKETGTEMSGCTLKLISDKMNIRAYQDLQV